VLPHKGRAAGSSEMRRAYEDVHSVKVSAKFLPCQAA